MTRRWTDAALVLIAVAGLASGGAERCRGDWALLTLGAPFQSGGDGFFENVGVGFGFNIPGASADRRPQCDCRSDAARSVQSGRNQLRARRRRGCFAAVRRFHAWQRQQFWLHDQFGPRLGEHLD